MQLDLSFEFFLRSLIQYAEDPSPTLTFDLQHKVIALRAALRQESAEMEKRITENVLKNVSIQLHNNGAITEIESLRKAIEQLEK